MTTEVTFGLEQARALAQEVHEGQVDKLGNPYYPGHLEPIAARLREEGAHAEMAGLLHDILEDTKVTEDDLRAQGVPDEVVDAVVAVTRVEQEDYDELIARSAAHPLGRIVKLADNAHNLALNDDLAKVNPEKAAELRTKYERARRTLWAAGITSTDEGA